MTDRKTTLKPSRRPRPEDIKGATRRAREFADRLRAKYPDREFADSTDLVREDRDNRR